MLAVADGAPTPPRQHRTNRSYAPKRDSYEADKGPAPKLAGDRARSTSSAVSDDQLLRHYRPQSVSEGVARRLVLPGVVVTWFVTGLPDLGKASGSRSVESTPARCMLSAGGRLNV
jgi:hypothetical protein